jgi:enoyl-CoA hydratase
MGGIKELAAEAATTTRGSAAFLPGLFGAINCPLSPEASSRAGVRPCWWRPPARFADTRRRRTAPGWGGSVRMARLIGLNRAKELALTGRFLGADEALAWGFVNHVVPPEELMAKAESIAGQMAAAVPETLIAYKRLLDDEAALPLDQALALERRASLANNAKVKSQDIDARVAAMVARRKQAGTGA